jgi:predicted heme/steroid binding protein
MLSSLEIVICSVLILIAFVAFVIYRNKKSTPIEVAGDDKTQDITPMSHDPTVQAEILSKISKLENDLRNLSKYDSELTVIKSQLNQQRSFAGSDVLFCPETDDPMRRIHIEGEDIDVSQAGCWSDGFISKLHNIYKDSSIKKIEDSISKEREIESRKKYVAHLYSEYTRTNSSAIKDKISTHNQKIRYLIYGAPQGVSTAENSFLQTASKPISQSIYSHQITSSNSASATSSGSSFPQTSSLKCPASNLPMTRIDLEGIELDVSPYGVWFDGTENLGTLKPEILQVLEKKQNFFARLFGSQSLAKIIEQKTVDVSKKYELDIKKLEAKRSIIAHSANLSRISPESAEFSRQFIQLKVAIKSLEELG